MKKILATIGALLSIGALIAMVFAGKDYLAADLTEELDQRHADKAVEETLQDMNRKLDAQTAQATAQATALLVTIKNIQRGRRASYDNVPEEELTPREKQDRLIIDYDLSNLKQIEESVGLDVPDG